MAIPTARPMAGAPLPAVRWSSPAARACSPRARCRPSSRRIASRLLEAASDDIVLENGAARVAGTDRALPIETLARAAYHQSHLFKGEHRRRAFPKARPTIRPARSRMPATPPSSRSMPRPGGVTIERFIVAEDAGRLVNPMIADGQVMGGVAQGIGNALLEEIVYDDTGNMLTATLADFLPPTCREIPPIELLHLETLERRNGHRVEGSRRRRRHRRAGRGSQRDQRCADAVRRRASTKFRRRRNGSARRCGRQERARHERARRDHADHQRHAPRHSASSRGARWSMPSARIAGRPARTSAANTAFAAPARCWSTARRFAPV